MTKIEQIERKRLYNELKDELFATVNNALETSPPHDVTLDVLTVLGQDIDDTINRHILATELAQATNDDESAIALTRRVVASLDMSRKLDGRKLDYEQCCQIIISIVTSLRDQQKQLKETLKKLNKDYNVQVDWYIDAKGKRQEYQRNA